MRIAVGVSIVALSLAALSCASDEGTESQTTNSVAGGGGGSGGAATVGTAGANPGVSGAATGVKPPGGGGSAAGPIVPPVGAGGTAPMGNAGTPNVPGGAGSPGGAGAPAVGGLGEPLISSNGWVAGNGNTLGIQGAFYTFSDGTSTIAPADYSMATADGICATGTATVVVDEMYAMYWGAGVGFNLSQLPDDPLKYPFDAATKGLTGFSFTIAGATVPPSLRFKVMVAGDLVEYCKDAIVAGENVIKLSELLGGCYEGGPMMGTPNLTMLEAIQWQIVTNSESEVPYDFCITNLAALTD